jgi:hypothetical protein
MPSAPARSRSMLIRPLWFALCLAPLHAATVFVGPTRPITTIQAGINAANPGDSISIDPGTYPEADVINRNFGVTGLGIGGSATGNSFLITGTSVFVSIGGTFSSSVEIGPGAGLTATTVGNITVDPGGFLTATTSSGNVTFSPGSTFSLLLGGPVTAAGTVNLNSATLSVSLLSTVPPGFSSTIVSASAITGTFNGLPNNAVFTAAGTNFRINYTSTSVTLTVLAPSVPSVSNAALLLLACGLVAAGILLAHRRDVISA